MCPSFIFSFPPFFVYRFDNGYGRVTPNHNDRFAATQCELHSSPILFERHLKMQIHFLRHFPSANIFIQKSFISSLRLQRSVNRRSEVYRRFQNGSWNGVDCYSKCREVLWLFWIEETHLSLSEKVIAIESVLKALFLHPHVLGTQTIKIR
jgi:hypothetical protein